MKKNYCLFSTLTKGCALYSEVEFLLRQELRETSVYHYIIETKLHEFASLTFEDICKEYVRELQKKSALPFRYSEYLDTLAKLASQKANAEFYYALFSESGFDEKIIEEAKNNNILLYSLDDIVQMKV